MSIYVISRACHHPDDLDCVTRVIGEVKSHIVGIVKSFTSNSDKLDANKTLVLDARLLERFLTTLIFTVKSVISQNLSFPFYFLSNL